MVDLFDAISIEFEEKELPFSGLRASLFNKILSNITSNLLLFSLVLPVHKPGQLNVTMNEGPTGSRPK